MSGPHVIIAMVSFRDPELILKALAALDGSTHRDFTVSIVENGGPEAYDALLAALSAACPAPDDATAPAARVRRVVRLRLPSGPVILCGEAHDNGGYGAGVNIALEQGAMHAPAADLWVLNPDTVPDRDALRAMIAHARASGHALVGSRLVLSRSRTIQLYGGIWRSWLGRGYNIGLGAPADATPDVTAIEAAMNYVSGASMYVTRRFLDQVGPMPEHYFLYCEEVDWCLSRGALTLGYAHEAIVLHDHGATMGSSISRMSRSALSVYLDERNRILLTRKHFPKRLPIALIMSILIVGKYITAGAWRNCAFALRGLWAGLRGEQGRPALFFPDQARSPKA